MALSVLSLVSTAFSATEPAPARLLPAFFGLDNALPRGANNLCAGAAGQDGMPVMLSRTTDPGELRTVLLNGEFGDAENDPPERWL